MNHQPKLKAALIGLGVNTQNYADGFKYSNVIDLVVTCDIRRDAPARALFANVPYMQNYEQIIDNYVLDVVFIVTPPSTHYAIAKYFLDHKIAVVIEKPPVLTFDAYLELSAFAKTKATPLITAYHWTFGPELMAFKKELARFGKLIHAKISVNDPYAYQGYIHEDKIGLAGAWLDSGSNLLSAFSYLFPTLIPHFLAKNFIIDPRSGLPLYAHTSFEDQTGAHFEIEIDWREKLDYKRSIFTFEHALVTINHSAQSIDVNGTLFASFATRARLLNHYYEMLRDFSFESLKKHEMTLDVLKFLYEVNDNVQKNQIPT